MYRNERFWAQQVARWIQPPIEQTLVDPAPLGPACIVSTGLAECLSHSSRHQPILTQPRNHTTPLLSIQPRPRSLSNSLTTLTYKQIVTFAIFTQRRHLFAFTHQHSHPPVLSTPFPQCPPASSPPLPPSGARATQCPCPSSPVHHLPL